MITVETRPGAIVLLVFALILLGTWGPLLNLAERRGRHTVHTYMVRFYGHADVLICCNGIFLHECAPLNSHKLLYFAHWSAMSSNAYPLNVWHEYPAGFQHRICAGAHRLWLHPRPVWGHRERRGLLVSARPFACEGLISSLMCTMHMTRMGRKAIHLPVTDVLLRCRSCHSLCGIVASSLLITHPARCLPQEKASSSGFAMFSGICIFLAIQLSDIHCLLQLSAAEDGSVEGRRSIQCLP